MIDAGPRFETLVDRVLDHAARDGDREALVFLSDAGAVDARMTYGELARATQAVACQIAERAARGDRILLMFPPGLDFVVSFLACLMTGRIAAPLMLPRRTASRDASSHIIADCRPTLALTNALVAYGPRADLPARLAGYGVDMLVPDASPGSVHAPAGGWEAVDAGTVAFLQYTSGSTSAPKGVVVRHGNLMANLEMIRAGFGTSAATTFATWIPHYHDMGLVLTMLEPLYVGAACVMMAPAAFMQRPLLWLKAISDTRAEIAGAPNFAFDLCVERFRADRMEGIDLSSWKVAFNGAEPIHAETIDRFVRRFAPYGFDAAAVFPAYGMAETTLYAASGERGRGAEFRTVSRAALQNGLICDPDDAADARRLVSCGHAAPCSRILVVNPETLQTRASLEIGEVWVQGAHVVDGYWNNPTASVSAFQARPDGDSAGESWLRTGDLGFLDERGCLFITGRIKDLIIIRGKNHYPQDIELSVAASHPALRTSGGAAFTVSDDANIERLIVVHEVERTQRHDLDVADVVGAMREAVSLEHELALYEAVLIGPGALPKTTSGKVQRQLVRKLWIDGQLPRLNPAR